MSEKTQKAEKIIERFGGIRPMAAKMGVPVTTVQGWKKRDAIPENRIDEIVSVARSHNIDLSDVLSLPVNEVGADDVTADFSASLELEAAPSDSVRDQGGQAVQDTSDGSSPARVPMAFSVPPASADSKPKMTDSKPGAASGASIRREPPAREVEVRAIKTSSLISVALVLLVAIGSASYLWPMLREHNERITGVETEVEDLRGDVAEVREESQEVISSTSKSWSEQLADIQRQAEEAKAMAAGALNTATKEAVKVQGQLMEGDVSGLYEKAQQFDQYVTDMTAKSPALQGFVNALDSLLDEEKGRKTISDASTALSAAFSSGTGEAQGSAEDVIDKARQSDPAAAAVFEGVPKEDLKAAGVMLSLSQLRDSLSQDGKPFDQDLGLLKNMVGSDNPELAKAIDEAEPKAKQGVFSPSTLASMFDSMSGKVVEASLEGEDASLGEQAKARLNSLVQVEKDGELITGTSTQATLNKAKRLLSQGDVRGARAVIDTLPESEKSQLQDWMNKADATIQVQDLSAVLDSNLSSIIGIDDFLSSYYITRQGKSLR